MESLLTEYILSMPPGGPLFWTAKHLNKREKKSTAMAAWAE